LVYSKQGDTTRLDRQAFESESDLQDYICRCPEAIPIDELVENGQLHILAREYETASGPIDALGTDAEGSAYIIETKLYRNADKRRVIAQVLDYGAALWAHPQDLDQMVSLIKDSAEDQAGVGAISRLAAFLGSDESGATEHLADVLDALVAGRFTAIILMDQLDDRLRDLIRFINGASQFRVLAVEIEYYRHDDVEIVVPSVFGAEGRPTIQRPSTSTRRQWDESSFTEELRRGLEREDADAVISLYEFCDERCECRFGTGSVTGSFNPLLLPDESTAPFTVWTDGTLEAKFSWLPRSDRAAKLRDCLRPEFQRLGLEFSDPDAGDGKWPVELWAPQVNAIIDVLKRCVQASAGERPTS